MQIDIQIDLVSLWQNYKIISFYVINIVCQKINRKIEFLLRVDWYKYFFKNI